MERGLRGLKTRTNTDFFIIKSAFVRFVRVVRVPFYSKLCGNEYILGTELHGFHGFSGMITQNSRVNPCLKKITQNHSRMNFASGFYDPSFPYLPQIPLHFFCHSRKNPYLCTLKSWGEIQLALKRFLGWKKYQIYFKLETSASTNVFGAYD